MPPGAAVSRRRSRCPRSPAPTSPGTGDAHRSPMPARAVPPGSWWRPPRRDPCPSIRWRVPDTHDVQPRTADEAIPLALVGEILVHGLATPRPAVVVVDDQHAAVGQPRRDPLQAGPD